MLNQPVRKTSAGVSGLRFAAMRPEIRARMAAEHGFLDGRLGALARKQLQLVVAGGLDQLEPRTLLSAETNWLASDPLQRASGCSCGGGVSCGCTVQVSEYGPTAGVKLTIAPAVDGVVADDAATPWEGQDTGAGLYGGSLAAISANLPSPVMSLPVLSSFPSATRKIYLDFDGSAAVNWGTYSVPATPSYDIDGNASSFNNTEIDAITRIWARVAEKFSPFNLDVTTVAPSSYASGQVVHVVIGGDGNWLGNAGGAAYVNGFTLGNTYGSEFNFNKVFVFPKKLSNGNVKYTAEATAHEVGHAFGLEHQSSYSGTTRTEEYNSGTVLKAPIMGSSYSATRGLWWSGPTAAGSTVMQDDLALLSRSANGFGYRADDHGNSLATARALVTSSGQLVATGVIETTADVDAFSFSTKSGPVSLTLSPAAEGAMLDAVLKVYDSGGALVASYDTSALGEFAQMNLTQGTYTVLVSSKGNYGDIGSYTLTGTVVEAERPPTAPSNLLTTASPAGIALVWADNSTDETGFRLQRSTDGGSSWSTLVVVSPNTTTYTDGTAPFGTNTLYRIAAENSVGVSTNSNSAGAVRVPGAVTGLKRSVVSGTQVSLSWTDIVGETSYRVERSTDGNTWVTAGVAAANATSFVVSGLAGSTAYSFRIVSMVNTTAGFSSASVTATTVPTAPETVSGIGTGSTAARITWSAVTGAAGYRVQRQVNGTWTNIANLGSGILTYNQTGLATGETTVLRVRAYNSSGDGDVSAAVTTGALPTAVSGVAATAQSSSSIRVTWTDLNHESGYVLEVAPAGTSNFSVAATVGASVTSSLISGLLAGTAYSVRVKAVTSGGQGPASTNSNVTTHPAAPSNVTVTTVSTTSVRVAWSDGTGESGYRIERLIPSVGAETWQPVITLGTNAGSYTISSLTPGTTVTVRVVALFNGGESAPSASATGETSLASPVNVTATATTSSDAVVTWSDGVGESAYLVEYRVTGGTWAEAGSVASGVTSYTVGGLTSATAYQFRVTAKSATQSSAPSSSASATTKLAAPTGIVVAPKEQSYLEVTWNAVTGASSYVVERSIDGVLFFTAVTASASSGNLYKDTSVDGTTTYYYRVSAVGAAGRSEPSEIEFAAPSESQPIPPPSGQAAVLISNSSARITWNDNSSTENGFTIERSLDGGVTFTKLTTTAKNSTSYTDNALAPGAIAVYRVAAAGRFVSSEFVTTNSVATKPSVVTGLNVQATTTTTATYRWSAAVGATSYRVELSLDGTNFEIAGTTVATQFTVDGLTPDTGLKVRVVAIAAGGEANASTAVTARTQALVAPGAPTNLAVAGRTASSITFTWSAVVDASSYRVYRSLDGVSYTQIAEVTGAEFNLQGLQQGSPATLRVTALSPGGESSPSVAVTGYAAFVPASNLDARAVTDTGADIAWAAGEGASSYVLTRSTDGVNFSTVIELPATVTGYFDDSLSVGVTYTYQLITVGADGTEIGSNLSSVTTQAGESERPPGSLTATFTSADRLTLSWLDFSENETGFAVQMSIDGGLSYRNVRVLKANNTSLAGIRLTRGADVTFRVLVMNGKTVVAESRTTNVTVVPGDVRSVKPSVSSGGISLAFAGQRGADSYVIQRATDGVNFADIGTTTAAAYVDSDVEPGTIYQYRVLAANEGGRSNPGRAATALTAPASPTLVGASLDDKGRVVISWNDVAGESGFRLEQSADGATWRRVGQTRANVTALAVAAKGHGEGQTLSYRIAAFNKSGSSATSGPVAYAREGGTLGPAITAARPSFSSIFSQSQVDDNGGLGKKLAA